MNLLTYCTGVYLHTIGAYARDDRREKIVNFNANARGAVVAKRLMKRQNLSSSARTVQLCNIKVAKSYHNRVIYI